MNTKNTKLAVGILFDLIGCMSYLFPGIGELTDIVWAPISAWLMTKMYTGKKGKIAAVINFIEEAIPGLDIIPSFTLMWVYTYVYSKSEETLKVK
ncbi:MAG: hypothetical protein ABIO60_06900 [Aquaticitalea sp.]